MTSEDEKPTSSNFGASNNAQDGEKDQEKTDGSAVPSHVAGSGTLDRLVDTARDYARQATSENTNLAYKKDWAHFSSWCRRRGADTLPPSAELIGLYIANCAAPV